MRCIVLALTFVVVAGRGALTQSTTRGSESVPVYATPYYDSRGPVVNVGPLSEALTTSNRDSLLATTRAMEGQHATLPVEAMYVAAVRLYDLGAREDALYWFYAAQYRARLFHAVADSRAAAAPFAETREQWGARSAEIGAGLRELATYLRSNWAELEADRARNGADERFCR